MTINLNIIRTVREPYLFGVIKPGAQWRVADQSFACDRPEIDKLILLLVVWSCLTEM